MNTLKFALGMLLVTLTAAGCTGQPVKLSATVDPRTVDLTKGRPIYAEAGGFQLLWVIPINVNSRQVRAYDELKRMAGNDAMADISVTESWTYAYIGTLYWTELKAMAYPKLRQQPPARQ